MADSNRSAALSSPFIKSAKRVISPLIRKNQDVFLGGSVILILALLVIPLPTWLLDGFLSINITLSILILLISLYIRTPLDFNAFPTILLIVTLFRLGLNVATTRLILGQAEAGKIIHAFGDFVIGGNYVVGIIIFIILMVINFIVIIKGSTRIAEVTARFTLDALPGKQMSIDADLNAGYIDEKTARNRRQDLNREADFFGAMDGASKFIKGDAIAGIVITIINLLAGFAVGVLQLDMSAGDAAATYTILTIGDGLVSQMPSLFISIAGGLVITRSASENDLDTQIGEQFGNNPRPILIAAAAVFLIGLLPGFPIIPFTFLALMMAGFALYRRRTISDDKKAELAKEAAVAEETKKKEEPPVEDLLKVDPIEVELGYNLISLVDEAQGGDVFKRITNVRKQLATELGIILPPVRVRDNLQLEPHEYCIKIRGNEIARNVLYPKMLLAMNPGNAEGEPDGIQVTEPVFGLPATWINTADREEAEINNFTVVEAATVLTTHMTELLRDNAHKLLTRQDVTNLIENLKDDYPALVEEVKPENLPTMTVQSILKNLLKEGIPIRDLPIILESLSEYYKVTQNTDVLTEYVRHNLSETIKQLFEDKNGVVHGIALDPYLEDAMTKSLQQSEGGQISPTLGLSPEIIHTVNANLKAAIDEMTEAGHLPLVICSAQVRPYFYRMVHSAFPALKVISYTELPADTEVEIPTALKLQQSNPQPAQ